MNRVERWYRVTVSAYPPEHLTEREEELIGTLMAATPATASRPPRRELAALVVHGLAERGRRRGALTRRSGIAGAALVALAGAIAIASMTIVGQMSPLWSAPYPRAFLPMWLGLLGLAGLGHLPDGRRRTATRAVIAGLGLTALVLGPASTLMSRQFVLAFITLAMIASLRPASSRRWPAAVAVVAGATCGRVVARLTLDSLFGGHGTGVSLVPPHHLITSHSSC